MSESSGMEPPPSRPQQSTIAHLVSAWVAANNVALGQVATDAKSNEITAIPALLDLLEIRGAVVSIDEMGCQKAIAAKIVEREADYLLSLKDNYPTARHEVAAYFAGAIHTPTVHSHETMDGDHGRVEVRRFTSRPTSRGLPIAPNGKA